jgi:phosphotransferase system enzyme I (PtsI)
VRARAPPIQPFWRGPWGSPASWAGAQFDLIPRSGLLALDGGTGEVVTEPDEASLVDYSARKAAHETERALLSKYIGKEAVTADGRRVLVAANIGGPGDIDAVIKYGGDGVGLFRSEFLYLESEDFPSEEAQYAAYKTVLERFSPRPVVVRTFDLGSDKQAAYFPIENEENPALGWRAVRICLDRPEFFITQLRALLRASVHGKLCVMFPMISHLEQVLKIKELVAAVKRDLDAAGLPYSGDVELGIMVETPAAALLSDALAKEVDFFSVGTNDLTQYTLAVDRTNARLGRLFDSAHPAVLRLIEMTAKNAHHNGIWVGICGESAANTALTDFYMSLSIDELSVAPASIPQVKRAVIECRPRKKQ